MGNCMGLRFICSLLDFVSTETFCTVHMINLFASFCPDEHLYETTLDETGAFLFLTFLKKI